MMPHLSQLIRRNHCDLRCLAFKRVKLFQIKTYAEGLCPACSTNVHKMFLIRRLLDDQAMEEALQNSSSIGRPLAFSVIAGLSTSVGALLAVLKRPDQQMMAFLLGLAAGVMITVSVVELIVRNALEHNALLVLISAGLGALAYYLLALFMDTMGHKDPPSLLAELPSIEKPKADQPEPTEWKENLSIDPSLRSQNAKEAASYLRLGLLMALTLTLHNLPEGFAVAFTSYTSLGPIMTLAIALHNIPEGIVIAAPIYAATGSRFHAIALATASGLSEPVGALIALLLLRPFLNLERLQFVLASTGGLMLAVSLIELIPEARKCKNDNGMLLGLVTGTVLMGFTLVVGI
jgi:ZIP family zinc transporter